MSDFTVTYNIDEKLAEMDKNVELRIEAIRKAHERDRVLAEKTLNFLNGCAQEGLVLKVPYDLASPVFTVEMERVDDTRVINKVAGPKEQDFIAPAEDDARKRLVWVYMRPTDENFNHIQIRYKRRVKPDDKCKLVRMKPSKGSLTMVCEDN